jgi:hypothetical protein
MVKVVIVGEAYYGDRFPDQGLPGGGGDGPAVSPPIYHPGHPDHGLPSVPPGYWGGERPGRPPHPGNRPPGSWGGPVDPGYGWPGGGGHPDQGLPGGGWGGGRPDQGLPGGGRPPHVWPRPPGGGLPVDPGWGIESGRPDQGLPPASGQLPVFPVDPTHPDNTLPPVEGVEPPPTDPPPGTVWPPLPPSIPAGKAIALVLISGVGYRYAVIDIPENKPPLPPRPQPK